MERGRQRIGKHWKDNCPSIVLFLMLAVIGYDTGTWWSNLWATLLAIAIVFIIIRAILYTIYVLTH